MAITFPNESAEYREARDQLLGRERELRVLMEAVAAERRDLPPGGEVTTDYVFTGVNREGRPTELRLGDLFAPEHDTLVIYNFMFPRDPGDERPGPVDGATAGLPLKEGPVHRARRCWTSWTALHGTRPRGSASRLSPRHRSTNS